MCQRVHKILAAAGIASRRACEDLMRAGRVTVNGRTVTEPGVLADPAADDIRVDGKPIPRQAPRLYIVLNKPTGYASTVRDPHAPHTIMELLHGVPARVYPVGRLDVDTAGLILLTNDGDFAHKLQHPSYGVPRTYRAVVRGLVADFAVTDLRRGIALEDGLTAPADVAVVERDPRHRVSVLDITIREGRYRQVRRMLAAVGHPVLALTRTRFGPLALQGLAPGIWRKLRPEEVEALLREAGSSADGAAGDG